MSNEVLFVGPILSLRTLIPYPKFLEFRDLPNVIVCVSGAPSKPTHWERCKAVANIADSLPDDQEPLTISINSKGEIYIQEHQVTYQKMIPKLLAIAKNRTDTRIYVRGDKNINYGRVLEVMGTLSGAGFSKVALISEPYKN